jgi:protein-tyrosine phosphatase
LTDNYTNITKKCHTGNTAIYSEPKGGTLYIGGWNQGAYFNHNTHVIDLTGTEHKYWDIPTAYDDDSKEFLQFTMQAYAGWLSLPFPDYQIPNGMSSYAQWKGMADTIQKILRKGHDVLVACHGGHGRSGLFCAIVGYILNIKNDRTWSSPVEKIREIHCVDAVETLKQEQFVYNVLGLRIQINHTYYVDDADWGKYGTWAGDSDKAWAEKMGTKSFLPCPICKTSSMYVGDFGMCLGCQNKYKEIAAIREDLTVDDISAKTQDWCPHPEIDIEHKCMGIWKASKCGHVVHDQIIYEGLCQKCYERMEQEQQYADRKEQELDEMCCVCGKSSSYSLRYGICYECGKALDEANRIDEIHNSITDPYRAVPHTCEADVQCVGIFKADVCKHIVHDREVEEGLCPVCLEIVKGQKKEVL